LFVSPGRIAAHRSVIDVGSPKDATKEKINVLR